MFNVLRSWSYFTFKGIAHIYTHTNTCALERTRENGKAFVLIQRCFFCIDLFCLVKLPFGMQNTWDSDKSLYELRVHQFAILANSVLCSATTKSDETRSTNEDEDHTYVSLLIQPISIINHCNLRPPSSSLRTSQQ
jgi:hypothetical protein